MINQIRRRQQPVWYNKQNDTVLFVSVLKQWHISAAYNYVLDNFYSWASADLYGKNGNARCPQDLVYKLWLNGNWENGTDLSVTSSRVFILYKSYILLKINNMYDLFTKYRKWDILL